MPGPKAKHGEFECRQHRMGATVYITVIERNNRTLWAEDNQPDWTSDEFKTFRDLVRADAKRADEAGEKYRFGTDCGASAIYIARLLGLKKDEWGQKIAREVIAPWQPGWDLDRRMFWNYEDAREDVKANGKRPFKKALLLPKGAKSDP